MKKLKSLAYKITVLVWKIYKPKSLGARAILIRDGEILLVKHTYQSQWYLPGGGLKYGETYEEAIRRELKEELNAAVNKMELFGVYNNTFEGKNDSVTIFLSNDFDVFEKKHNSEVSDVRYFKLDSLPKEVSPGTRRRISEYISKRYPGYGRW